MSELLTLADVCIRFHISDRRARGIVKLHRVPVLKPGRKLLFDEVALRAFTEACRCSTVPPAQPVPTPRGSRAVAGDFARALALADAQSPKRPAGSTARRVTPAPPQK
jgi:hypothetical protein